jgi:hypothetical protein
MIALGGGTLTPVPFTTVDEGQQSAIEDGREVVIRTAAEWKTFWKQHSPGRPMPAVDFTKATVVGILLGQRNTGGYRVTITAIDREGADLLVTWREQKPAPDLMVTQALTYPYHLVRIARSSEPVKFRSAADR